VSENLNLRVVELEKALQQAVDYLKRMPVVPTTMSEIRSAEAVLKRATPTLVLRGERMMPSGDLALRAELVGDVLSLTTGDVDYLGPDHVLAKSKWLYEALQATYQIKIAPIDPRNPLF